MLKVQNTLTRKKEVFKPREKKKVKLFVCGITSYDSPHLGHARTYIVFDMIVKYLRQKGYEVFYLQNITDIDDKIIARAREQNIAWQKLSRKFEREYLEMMKKLRVDSVTKYARATAHIKEIISQVERLLKKGFAYQIEDGVYYDISKFKDYGKLSGRTVFSAEDAVSRIDEAKKKRNKGDFCLWKLSKKDEPGWQSPFGWGRPGWHIEDTAITEKYFGPQYDIHGGGRDLIFPHHEAEICQMEAISDKSPMVKYWLHTGFLTVQGKKMAKSVGNFITIKDFLQKFSPRVLRFFFSKTHYRSPIDYSKEAILQAERELERLDEFKDRLRSEAKLNPGAKDPRKIREIHTQMRAFQKAMEDDFNTPRGVGAIFDLINKGNILIDRGKMPPKEAENILAFFKEIDEFFNFIFWEKKKTKIPAEILKLVEKREELRRQKKWKEADKIRQKIKESGFLIQDTLKGPKISPLK